MVNNNKVLINYHIKRISTLVINRRIAEAVNILCFRIFDADSLNILTSQLAWKNKLYIRITKELS